MSVSAPQLPTFEPHLTTLLYSLKFQNASVSNPPPTKRLRTSAGEGVAKSGHRLNKTAPASVPEVGKKRKHSEVANGGDGNENGSEKKGSKKEPFRRVRAEEIEIKHDALKDNSYKSFDTWGAKASKDLIVTKGKGFRSEKTKKKRGSYRGGSINVGINSFRFADSD